MINLIFEETNPLDQDGEYNLIGSTQFVLNKEDTPLLLEHLEEARLGGKKLINPAEGIAKLAEIGLKYLLRK